MTVSQKRKILARISEIDSDLTELKRVRAEIAKNGYASATMSSGGGSRSYTRLDLSKITEAILSLTSELKKLRAMLVTVGEQGIWRNVLVVYDM